MYTLDDLKEFVTKLRAKDGCPWDSVQTHDSMKRYLVEETAEVLEAIENKNPDNLCEELGDLLYQIMIHAEIEKENGNFTIDDVIDDIPASEFGVEEAVRLSRLMEAAYRSCEEGKSIAY